MAKKTKLGGRRAPIRAKKRKKVKALAIEDPEEIKLKPYRIPKRRKTGRSRAALRKTQRKVNRVSAKPKAKQQKREEGEYVSLAEQQIRGYGQYLTEKPKPIEKTTEVRRVISQRGRTHVMEAPLPGMPTTPQELLLESTAIKRFKYWIETQRLRIWFVKGGVYDYYNVPESVVRILSQAQSKGRFFYYNIRMTYNYLRII